MNSWDEVIHRLKQHLDDNSITYELIGDVIHTELCTIEVSGYPNKPEYWVNEVRIRRLEDVANAVHSCVLPA